MTELLDIIIIGAGVSGTAIARELSRYQAKILVLDKEEDLCCGTSKANSAIVHAGYDAANGSLMAKLNVQGSVMMPNATVKRGAVVKYAILGEESTVGEGVHIGAEKEICPKDAWGIAVVGKGKTVLDGAIVSPGEII